MLSTASFPIRGRKALLLANRSFSTMWAKTAACFLMYRQEDVVAVLDADHAGKTAGEVLGFGGNVPVAGTIEEALATEPEIAIVGTAPVGGVLDGGTRGEITACLRAGVDVVSGLHVLLENDAELSGEIARSGAAVWDVRKVRGPFGVSKGDGCTTGARSVLTVGTDCNVGKMTVALELCEAAVERGINASWAATGQTGMILRERGICIDRVISDFMGGASEELVNAEGVGRELVFVEGQGAIFHPGYAGVTLGLLYGVMPDCMVLVHVAGREKLKRLETPIMPLAELIKIHERAMAPFKRTRVAAVALNTSSLNDGAARAEVARVTEETGLAVADVVRSGSAPVLDAVLEHVGISRSRGEKS